ncbi:MAG: hypothetical protein ACI4PG_01415 [Candidatus Ventricola sp.]
MKRARGLLALAALIAVCAGALGIRHMTAGRRVVAAEALAPTAERDFVDFSGSYDTGTRTLRGTQTMTLTNRTGSALEELVLRLGMNGDDPGAVAVSGAAIDGRSVSARQDADDPTLLRVDCGWQPGQTVTLTFTLMIRCAKADGATLITLPALDVWEDGAWRTDAWDALAAPGVSQAFDCAITLDVQRGTQVAPGGDLTAVAQADGIVRYTAQLRGARDATFAMLEDGCVRQGKAQGVLITAMAPSGRDAARLLARTREALASLEKIGLRYPFASLTVAKAQTARADGVAYSGLLALDAQGDDEALLRRLTRLIARESFGVQVGVDPFRAPWLSETLASASELLAYRARKGAAAYETRFFEELEPATRLTRPHGVRVGAGVDRFGDDAEMTQVLRDQGAAMLLGIGMAAGEEALADALCRYAQENAGQLASQAALERALQEVTGSAWGGYLADGLGD